MELNRISYSISGNVSSEPFNFLDAGIFSFEADIFIYQEKATFSDEICSSESEAALLITLVGPGNWLLQVTG